MDLSQIKKRFFISEQISKLDKAYLEALGDNIMGEIIKSKLTSTSLRRARQVANSAGRTDEGRKRRSTTLDQMGREASSLKVGRLLGHDPSEAPAICQVRLSTPKAEELLDHSVVNIQNSI